MESWIQLTSSNPNRAEVAAGPQAQASTSKA